MPFPLYFILVHQSGGTYFLHDAKKTKIAVFKPADEEPYAANNPRGYLRQPGQTLSLREGVVPGEACMREVAAYLLDHDGFSGVPMTTLTEARHPAFNNNGSRLKVAEGGASIGSHSITSPGTGSTTSSIKKKVGSFQEFVYCECTIDDISPSKISVDEVHKIAILDIRIMNADRNAANLMVRRRRDNTLELVPIDHGFALRSVADVSWMDWCWLDWPQLKQPLSEESKRYILNLDIEADSRILLEQLNISPDAVDIFRASTTILKAGVKAGLTLYDIAVMCCRNDDLGEVPSSLESLLSMAEDLSMSALENGRWHHSAASRALAEQLKPHQLGSSFVRQRRSSMGSCSSHSASKMIKSASSVHFTSMVSDLKESLAEADAKDDNPGNVQSSASDSSSEAGDGVQENEDCDEWAANLLTNLNVSMDRSMSMSMSMILKESRTKDGRSPSLGSEDDSDEGFWHTRPGSPAAMDDDSSWNLSPECSPIQVDVPPGALIPLPEPSLSVGGAGQESFRSPTVHFAEDALLDEEFEVPARNSLLGKDDPSKSKPSPALPKADGMKRSQSYSAISGLQESSGRGLLSASVTATGTMRPPEPCTKEFDQYRDYFLKFVDLVIVREVKAATAQSRVSHMLAA